MPARVISGDVRALEAANPAEFKDALKKAGIQEIDTAARYMNGESEKKIGQTKLASDFTIDTKILFSGDGARTLTAEAIEQSLSNSLSVMGVEKVNVLYCHGPDMETPVTEQAKAFHEQYEKGQFRYLGVSNFPISMIEEWLSIAEQNGYVKPTVYQGQYNLLCRGYEIKLFPLLRKHGMVFRGFSPLAGGFLLGNFTAERVQGGSRFTVEESPFMKWYNKPSMHEAVKQLRDISERAGVGMDELSLRWLVFHSALSDDDGIILGGSKVHQISRNAAQIKKGPLDKAIVKELDGLWDVVKEDAMMMVEHDNYLLGNKRPT